jgi:DNA-binding response OmpR family regulator
LQILLVEDHADTAQAVARLLTADGHVVQWAPDGAAALAAGERTDFELLICDLCLPGIGGCEVMRQLRGRGAMVGIAISGRSEPDFARRAAEAGFAHFLVKPIEWPELKARVGAVASGS